MNAPDVAAPRGEFKLTAQRSPFAPQATSPSRTAVSGCIAEPNSGSPPTQAVEAPWAPTSGAPFSGIHAEADTAVYDGRSLLFSSGDPELPDSYDDDEAVSGLVEAEINGEIPSQGRPALLLLQRSLVDTILDRFPGLRDPVHARFLAHTLVGQNLYTSVDRSGCPHTRVIISVPTLERLGALLPASARGYGQELYSELSPRSDVAWPFLHVHQTILPDFRWTSWLKGEWSRQVDDAGLPADVLDHVLADLAVPVAEAEPLIDFADGREVPDPTTGNAFIAASEDLKRRRTRASWRAAQSRWFVQKKLLGLLARAPTNVVSRLVHSNAPAALAVALQITDADRRLRVLAALRKIQLSPAIVYVPSKRGRTPRVFADGVSLLGLPRAVRKALLAGCVELDLANAQLACAAALWRVGPLLDHLRREGSIWPHLLSIVEGSHGLSYDDAKAALKRAVFSVTFGMSRQGVRRRLAHDLSLEGAAAFLSDPLVKALLQARGRALKEVDAAGCITDCFGVPHAVAAAPGSKERWAECRSVLACTMQAMELQLLKPVIAEAERVSGHGRPAFRIVAWLHDGFAINTRREDVIRRLVRLVDEQAERLGVPTRLEATQLGVAPTVHSSTGQPVGRLVQEPTENREAPFGGWGRDGAANPRLAWLVDVKRNSLPGGPNGQCWLWQGPTDRDGYGRMYADGRRVRAHRWMWEAANGCPVPPGLVVRHRCNTPGCVRPSHLVVGTQLENIADRNAAGRTAKGEQNGRAILRSHHVREARRLVGDGASMASVARQFGINPTTVRDIMKGRIWAHLADDERPVP